MFDRSLEEAPGIAPEVLAAAALAISSEDLDAMTVEQAAGRGQRRRIGERLPIEPQLASAASLAALVHIWPRAMATHVFQARVVTRGLERTHQLAWHGELEPYRVEAVARAARDVGWTG